MTVRISRSVSVSRYRYAFPKIADCIKNKTYEKVLLFVVLFARFRLLEVTKNALLCNADRGWNIPDALTQK